MGEETEKIVEEQAVEETNANGESMPFFTWEKRKCTDIACLIIFALFWLGMIIIAIVGAISGDINRLLYATDYKGVTCGTGDGPQANAKRIVYPRMTEDILFAAQNLDFSPTAALSNLDKIDFYGICTDACPKRDAIVCNYEARTEMDKTTWPATYDTDRKKFDACSSGTVTGIDCDKIKNFCWFNILDTRSVMFRCFSLFATDSSEVRNCTAYSDNGDCTRVLVTTTSTEERTAEDNLVFDQFNSAYQKFNSYFSDVANSWYVTLVCGFVIALLASFSFVVMLRYCAGIIVYSIIVLTFLAGFGMLMVLYFKAGIISRSDITSIVGSVSESAANSTTNVFPGAAQVSDTNQDLYRYAAIVFTVLYIVMIGVVIFLRERIRIAIALIVESAKVIGAAPVMTLFPILTAMQIVALAMYWIFISGLLYTAGSTENVSASLAAASSRLPGNASFTKFSSDDALTYMVGYNTFGFIWTATFLHSMGTMAIIYVTGVWYFNTHSGDEDRGVKDETVVSGNKSLYKGYHMAWRFHMGSVAFGSFLVAVVIVIRIIVYYLSRRLEGAAKKNFLIKLLLKCAHCCLACIERCVRYITSAAYAIVVLHNKSFCSAGAHVVPMLIANSLRVGTVSTISFVVNLIAKIFVVCVAGGFSFLWLDNASNFQADGSTPISSAWLPVLFTMIVAFAIASVFFGVYEHIIDAILICFLEDERLHTNHGGSALEDILAENEVVITKGKKKQASDGDERLASA